MENEIKVTPISHATMVLGMNGRTIYTDPVGHAEAFKSINAPDIILVTDIHSDHLSAETLLAVSAADAVLEFKPKVVYPYHYRGPNGLSDIQEFKELVNKGDPSINVKLLNFYPES